MPAFSYLSVCRDLTHALGRARSADDICSAVLDALGDGLGANRAAILLFDPDGVLRFKASRGLSASYRRAMEGHTLWPPRAGNATSIAVPDVMKDAGLAPFLPVMQAEGIAAVAFVPLESVRGVIGKVSVYYAEPHVFSADEMQMAEAIAAQAALAIEWARADTGTGALAGLDPLDLIERSNSVSQRLAAIVESSDDAIVSKNLDGIITSWNRGAERMFGFTAAEAIGRSITLIVPDDRLEEEAMVLSSIRSGKPVEMETVRRHRNGSFRDISLVVSPVKDINGRIVGASKIARDITARKRDEAERAELHRRLTMLVDASASLLDSPEADSVQSATISIARQLLVADAYAVWATEPGASVWRIVKSEGVSSTFASRAVTLPGEAASTLLRGPMPVTDVFADSALEHLQESYREEGIRSMLVCPLRLGSGRSGTLVFYYRTPHVFGEADVQTAQAFANMAAAALTTADLYSEQRRQRQTAEAARRQAAFLANVTAILSQSLDYEETLAAVAKLAVPELADWCAVDMVQDSGRLQRLAVVYADPVKADAARRFEERHTADPLTAGLAQEVIRSGKPAVFGVGAADSPANSGDGALTSYICVPLASTVGTLGSITFALAGRRYTNEDRSFAQDVAARAALAIENAVAYRRANEANQLKDEFLATLSHELRTPLNAILGYAQMLNMGILNGQRQAKAIAVLTRNAHALKQMIEDVLDVSRITSGKLRLAVQPVDLDSVLHNAAASVQPAADAKGVSLQLAIDRLAPPVSGDPDRLQQVVWNLLSNAVKFTPRGGRVTLRLERAEGSIDISVTDNGKGIEPAFLPYIFERFRQEDSRFSREHGGLGLGLAIVRQLVELHGGTVTASSAGSGAGATFKVRLPSLLSPDAASVGDVKDEDRLVAPLGMSTRLKGARILAVDDEEDARGLLCTILESAGAEVTAAGSAREALDLLRHLEVEAIIADIGMPQMDGLEMIRNVRLALPPPANRLPAAALTAYARSEDRVAALTSGFQIHLAKPVNPIELVIAVAGLLGR